MNGPVSLPSDFPSALRRFVRETGLVLATFVLLIAFENVAVGLGYRSEFASSWEMRSARFYLSPVALVLSIPIAVSAVLIARLVRARRADALAALGFIAGMALAIGVTTGRRVSHLAIRLPLVAVLAFGGAVVAYALARKIVGWRPRTLAWAGAATAALCWLADAHVLPRLYPAFHLALFFTGLLAWGLTSLAFYRARWATSAAHAAVGLAALSLAWSPRASRRLAAEDNLRRVVLEHAPFLGRAVVIANRISPPAPIDGDDTAVASILTSVRTASDKRHLDWSGHDIVLVTIDALRADHVSSYGYRRTTTPNIDALAAKGTRFSHAYCPTPHTSYSIASMMTGKYMKPLLALATEDDSETWPVQLQRYGYRTAAFYPPAVFFIDEHRFQRLKDSHLGFEYAKEEFAKPELRREQVEQYLANAPHDKPLFLWVHLFEPHEPYESHPEFPFEGEPRVDAYDSEIATADALVGDIVASVGKHRPPGTVFIVSADHGEEHGDHGGRYHGTTVYEEQVRVPLVVVGPGIPAHVVAPPVQTIDLLPTSLAALDVPIPPRLRGRDLGAALAGVENALGEGLAFAETDDYTLVARGSDRLVCARKIGSCTLFDVDHDLAETRPVVDRAARVTELRKLTAAIERETGRIEATDLPDALRRGMQGDREAAEDVALLLDDSRVDIRRLAARCLYRLKAREVAPQLERAEKSDDEEVRRYATLALVRLGDESASTARIAAADAILKKAATNDEKYAAALALAEQGDPRGESELLARWTTTFAPGARGRGELDDARELLAALGKLRSREAVPALVRSLEDVRLRPHVVTTLAEIGDPRGKEALLRVLSEERYVHLRGLEARTLLKLGARDSLVPALTRFAGTPEPLFEAITIARDGKLLTEERGGWMASTKGAAPANVSVGLRTTPSVPLRLLVLPAQPTETLTGSVGGVDIPATEPDPASSVFAIDVDASSDWAVPVKVSVDGGVAALWLVPRADEIPPPPPAAWTAAPQPSTAPATEAAPSLDAGP